MKLLVFVAALFLLSCDTASVFESPNYVRNYPGKLYLVSGRTFEGRLSLEPGRPLAPDVELLEEGDKRAMHFRLDEVKGYSARGRYYELKERKGGLSLGRNFSFMSRLTPDTSRIHLYTDAVNRKVPLSGKTLLTMWETDFYLQMPGDDPLQVYPVMGTRYMPSFHEKMSELLSDCPDLAGKIRGKEAGYRVTDDRRALAQNRDALLRIVAEYNKCR